MNHMSSGASKQFAFLHTFTVYIITNTATAYNPKFVTKSQVLIH